MLSGNGDLLTLLKDIEKKIQDEKNRLQALNKAETAMAEMTKSVKFPLSDDSFTALLQHINTVHAFKKKPNSNLQAINIEKTLGDVKTAWNDAVMADEAYKKELHKKEDIETADKGWFGYIVNFWRQNDVVAAQQKMEKIEHAKRIRAQSEALKKIKHEREMGGEAIKTMKDEMEIERAEIEYTLSQLTYAKEAAEKTIEVSKRVKAAKVAVNDAHTEITAAQTERVGAFKAQQVMAADARLQSAHLKPKETVAGIAHEMRAVMEKLKKITLESDFMKRIKKAITGEGATIEKTAASLANNAQDIKKIIEKENAIVEGAVIRANKAYTASRSVPTVPMPNKTMVSDLIEKCNAWNSVEGKQHTGDFQEPALKRDIDKRIKEMHQALLTVKNMHIQDELSQETSSALSKEIAELVYDLRDALGEKYEKSGLYTIMTEMQKCVKHIPMSEGEDLTFAQALRNELKGRAKADSVKMKK